MKRPMSESDLLERWFWRRHAELEQERAQLVSTAFTCAVALLSGLLPADRDLAVRTFLAGLGRGPEVLEVTAS